MFSTKAGKEYEDTLTYNTQTNMILWRVALLQTFIICVLLYSLLGLKETVNVTVELPSKIYTNGTKSVKKGIGWASKSYFEIWASALLEDISTFSYENIGDKLSLIQKMMRPSAQLETDAKFKKFASAVVGNKITQSFIKDLSKTKVIDISNTHKKIIYEGVANVSVGKTSKKKECKYSIDLKIYENEVIYVEDFGTNCL